MNNEYTTTQQTVYELCITGIWGRNRKVKFDMFSLIELPGDSSIEAQELANLVAQKLLDIKAKSGKWHVTRDVEKLDDFGNGVIIRCRTIKFGGVNRVLEGVLK